MLIKNQLSSPDLCQLIMTQLEEKKALQIVKIDLQNKSSIADYLIIASGTSGRQIKAMSDFLSRSLKLQGISVQLEGLPACDWVLIDTGNVVVHLFKPEVRSFYNLEKMWNVDLPYIS